MLRNLLIGGLVVGGVVVGYKLLSQDGGLLGGGGRQSPTGQFGSGSGMLDRGRDQGLETATEVTKTVGKIVDVIGGWLGSQKK